jgi:hypothetical protein
VRRTTSRCMGGVLPAGLLSTPLSHPAYRLVGFPGTEAHQTASQSGCCPQFAGEGVNDPGHGLRVLRVEALWRRIASRERAALCTPENHAARATFRRSVCCFRFLFAGGDVFLHRCPDWALQTGQSTVMRHGSVFMSGSPKIAGLAAPFIGLGCDRVRQTGSMKSRRVELQPRSAPPKPFCDACSPAKASKIHRRP